MPSQNIEHNTADRRRFVLVVDSNARNQVLLTTLLNRFAYTPCVVGSAKEALKIATTVNPVLIVAACQIDANHDAREFIRSYRSMAGKSDAPIIVLTTANTDPAYERDCLSNGALTCLRAPVTFENFYRTVQVALEPYPRMTIRISINLPVSINGTRANESVRDISENGAYIATDKPYPLDSRLTLRIMVENRIVAAEARVIYAKPEGDQRHTMPGIGVLFEEITPEHQKRIRLFIRKEMTRDIKIPPKV